MATYYKKIKGKNYDKKIINAAEASVKGKGDGRISLNDAKKLLRTVKDSHDYSDIEKNTMKYLRDHYDFTPEADRWFRGEIRKWAASRGTVVKKAKKPARAKAVSRQKKPVSVPMKSREEEFATAAATSGRAEVDSQKPSSGPSLLRRIILFIIVVLIIILLFLLLIPSTRECIKNRISPFLAPAGQERIAPEMKTPVKEPQQGTPAGQTKVPEKPEESGDYYTVQVKDDLISISEKVMGNYSRWIDLYNANRDLIKNPTMIFPGQKLKIPPAK